jgi:hypothetical protein
MRVPLPAARMMAARDDGRWRNGLDVKGSPENQEKQGFVDPSHAPLLSHFEIKKCFVFLPEICDSADSLANSDLAAGS